MSRGNQEPKSFDARLQVLLQNELSSQAKRDGGNSRLIVGPQSMTARLLIQLLYTGSPLKPEDLFTQLGSCLLCTTIYDEICMTSLELVYGTNNKNGQFGVACPSLLSCRLTGHLLVPRATRRPACCILHMYIFYKAHAHQKVFDRMSFDFTCGVEEETVLLRR